MLILWGRKLRHREVKLPSVTWIVSRGMGILIGNNRAPKFVFLAPLYQHNSADSNFSNICICSSFLASVGPQKTGEAFCHCLTTFRCTQVIKSCRITGAQGALEAASGPPLECTLQLPEFSLKNEAHVFPHLPKVLLLSHSWFLPSVQAGFRASSPTSSRIFCSGVICHEFNIHVENCVRFWG